MHTINIIPLPDKVQLKKGVFELTPETRIIVSKDTGDIGRYLRDLLKPGTGYSLPIHEVSGDHENPDSILLTIIRTDKSLGDEGYELKVSPESIIIAAPAQAGLFYGVQTLRQLLPPQIDSPVCVADTKWAIPSVAIIDKPRFKWRGMHLDTGRHMFPAEFINKFIDLLAMHKMNTFHWHLTEDQGWRIEIKKYPKLTEIGAKRSATPIPSDPKKLDGKPYEGFYTQNQIKEIVAYAAKRFINIVPEIEMPGHSVAALASYPELGCTGGPYYVRQRWGIAKDVYCAGNENVYAFLEDVLTEVIDMFPSEFIHIGGDECPKDKWKVCSKCQSLITKEGLKDESELQSYFVKRIETFLNKKNRRLIGWDEILEGGLAPNAAIMSWRGMQAGIAAANMGHDVVMSPVSHCYFDYYQSKNKKGEPHALGGFLPLEKVYKFNLLPRKLLPDKTIHVLGAQGNVWTEYITNHKQLEYMVFPRASALSEVLWSASESHNYDDFIKRLPFLLHRLKFLSVNFKNPEKNK